MKTQEIKTLLDFFDQSTATVMKITEGSFHIELQRGGELSYAEKAVHTVTSAPVEILGKTINAPLVGTYYGAPSPDAPPFVTVGQLMKKGEPICLIEAMKMMSEVPAPCDCVIEELLQEDGALLAYDAPILRYRAV